MADVFGNGPTGTQLGRMPASSFYRIWSLGRSQARIACHFLSYAARKQFAGERQKERLQNEFYLQSALQLVGTMGYLRGAIMKIGQMLTNLPQILPRELVEVFDSLQFQAPPLHFSLIREVFLDEFGKEPEELFTSFEKEAFAAASLGQVHRAKLPSGEEVAVKIQYPNIAAAIEADLKTLALLLQTMRFSRDFKYLCAHVHDARQVFLKEVDYLSEAAFMEKNRRLFAGSQVVIPAHYPHLTSRRVLTMELLHGRHVQQFLADKPTPEQRNHYAALISYSLVRSWFQHRTVYADLHPGNYLLMDDGRLGVIDFGCYQQFNEERWRDEIKAEIGMFNGDEEQLIGFFKKVSMSEEDHDFDQKRFDLFKKQVEWIIAPIRARGPFDFAAPDHVQLGVALIKQMIKNGSAKTDPFYNWTNRALLGHRALMYRLRANFDYASLYLSEMAKCS